MSFRHLATGSDTERLGVRVGGAPGFDAARTLVINLREPRKAALDRNEGSQSKDLRLSVTTL